MNCFNLIFFNFLQVSPTEVNLLKYCWVLNMNTSFNENSNIALPHLNLVFENYICINFIIMLLKVSFDNRKFEI